MDLSYIKLNPFHVLQQSDAFHRRRTFVRWSYHCKSNTQALEELQWSSLGHLPGESNSEASKLTDRGQLISILTPSVTQCGVSNGLDQCS